ncbi:hypothetical protein MM1218R_01488 [Mycobacterium marinum]|uniref:hypothetical protein n=1 Tax=Mycobacterium marinum TaxID=1781 RepID=UPI000E28C873|nr:hypothetical protein [Mycobacterium marinum]AXN43436.1 hypothetical protein MM1218R_01488 [Mycobacterium marinum]RFZ11512.1 hypothetical protein DE4381_01100 [Mycobacterium marinum]
MTEGKHRSIRQHAFLQWRGDDENGCGRWEDEHGNQVDQGHPRASRCGYYRKHHPTMQTDQPPKPPFGYCGTCGRPLMDLICDQCDMICHQCGEVYD